MRPVARWTTALAVPLLSMSGVRAEHSRTPPAPIAPIRNVVLALSPTVVEDHGVIGAVDLVHDYLELPLNHLGLVVQHVDIRGEPPRDVDWSRVRAVLTWFRAEDRGPAWLWPWLREQVAPRPIRVVHFGDFGPLLRAPHGEQDLGPLNAWLRRFGLRQRPDSVEAPPRVRVEFAPQRTCDLEGLPIGPRRHHGPTSIDPRNEAWVTTIDRDDFGDERTPVVTGPWGGIALEPWALHREVWTGDRRWFIDPFEFFEAALGLEGVPAPDPCVLYGRRIFMLHVDGDGFESMSTVTRGRTCAEVMLSRILDRYRLPATVSVIVASLTDDYSASVPTPAMQIAAEILRRPWVEPASHSVLHPIHWRQTSASATPSASMMSYEALSGYQPDAVAEVRESIRFINERLLAPGKSVRMMLWSGMCNPTEEAILEAERLGCLNLNGGVHRWDALHDSLAFVPPWGKHVGSAYQVYCGAANENVFDGFFSTMPRSFRHIDRTIGRTGGSRILKPANVYVHFYSCDSPARLRVLERLIDRWALYEPTVPVPASVYAAAVADAQQHARIEARPDGWALRGFGACRTARIAGESRPIDWRRSRGLLGAKRRGDTLFVHLAAADADLIWATESHAAPHLVEADHLLREARRDEESVRFRSEAHRTRSALIGGLPPLAPVRLCIDGEAKMLRSDPRGRLRVRIDRESPCDVEVRIP